MTRGESFMERRKCKYIHCSSISNSARCDSNSKGNILKLHDKCPNAKCNCQEIISSTTHQYTLPGELIKNKLQKNFKRTKKACDSFIRTGLKMATALISAAVAAKAKSPQSAQRTNNILKSLTGGKIISLTDMHGHGFRLKVMSDHFK